MTTLRASMLILAVALSFNTACKKKVPPPPPPPAPKPAPVAEAPKPKPSIRLFTAEPGSIEKGQATTLKWNVVDATTVTISQGIGNVAPQGDRSVFPASTTTYTLTASNASGAVSESVTVNVNQAPPPPPPGPAAPEENFVESVAKRVGDVFFDYDKSELSETGRSTMTNNAAAIKEIFAKFPNGTITIEGHCDERGSAEYNLGLGDRRSNAAKEYLLQLGVPADRLRTVSYGKERPSCTESDESCWSKNRRAHFTGQ